MADQNDSSGTPPQGLRERFRRSRWPRCPPFPVWKKLGGGGSSRNRADRSRDTSRRPGGSNTAAQCPAQGSGRRGRSAFLPQGSGKGGGNRSSSCSGSRHATARPAPPSRWRRSHLWSRWPCCPASAPPRSFPERWPRTAAGPSRCAPCRPCFRRCCSGRWCGSRSRHRRCRRVRRRRSGRDVRRVAARPVGGAPPARCRPDRRARRPAALQRHRGALRHLRREHAGTPRAERRCAQLLCAGPRRAAIDLVVTTGLLRRLDTIELEGVIAHESAHVKRGDNGVSGIGMTLGRVSEANRGCGAAWGRAGSTGPTSSRRRPCASPGPAGALRTMMGQPPPAEGSFLSPPPGSGRTRCVWIDPSVGIATTVPPGTSTPRRCGPPP